jgi:hypothetical protein
MPGIENELAQKINETPIVNCPFAEYAIRPGLIFWVKSKNDTLKKNTGETYKK